MEADKRNPAVASDGASESSGVAARHHQDSEPPSRIQRPRPRTSPHYSWRITWKREGWLKEQVRHFEREHSARNHLSKLLGDGRPDLAPLAVVRLERRPVGAWREVQP